MGLDKLCQLSQYCARILQSIAVRSAMYTFTRSRLRALAMASVVALGLAGCGSDSSGRRHDQDRCVAAVDRSVLPARSGRVAWLPDLGDDDQRERRAAGPLRETHLQGRRVAAEHHRRRLQLADQPGQGRPADRLLLVAAELARVGDRRTQSDALRRTRRRFAQDVQARLPLPVLQPAGHCGPDRPGVRELDRPAAGGHATGDGGLPDDRRPVRRPVRRCHPRGPRKGRCANGVQRDLCPGHPKLRHHH